MSNLMIFIIAFFITINISIICECIKNVVKLRNFNEYLKIEKDIDEEGKNNE